MEQRTLEELPVEERLELLATTTVGRLGRNDEAGPSIVTVNFVVHRGGVLVRSLPGARLEAVSTGERVSFQADGGGPEPRGGLERARAGSPPRTA